VRAAHLLAYCCDKNEIKKQLEPTHGLVAAGVSKPCGSDLKHSASSKCLLL
jgi:hypothetical protein